MERLFKDILVGEKTFVEHVITENDIEVFAKLTGGDNPLCVDAKFAATTPCKVPVAH